MLLVKTIYLLELEYLIRFGEKFSEIPIVRITKGPIPQDYDVYFTSMERAGVITIDKSLFHKGQNFYPNRKNAFKIDISDFELDIFSPIISEVKSIMGEYPYDATTIVKNKAYATKPMVRYLENEKVNGDHIGGELLVPPFFIDTDIDPMAKMRRAYREHMKTAEKYSEEDAEISAQVLSNFQSILKSTNEQAAGS